MSRAVYTPVPGLVLDALGMPVCTDVRTSPNHTARSSKVTVEALCAHWSGGAFEGTLDWIGRTHYKGERIYASYHALFGAAGEVAYPVSITRASYSVGGSRADDPRFTWTIAGNSATENVALAGGPPTPPTDIQVAHLVAWLTSRMRAHSWGPDAVWRIRGHHQLAWPRGRKPDPEGSQWLLLDPIRAAVAQQLRSTVPSSARSA